MSGPLIDMRSAVVAILIGDEPAFSEICNFMFQRIDAEKIFRHLEVELESTHYKSFERKT